MKAIFLTLATVATISTSLIAGNEASPAPQTPAAEAVEKAVLSQNWTQCNGRFHYTFSKDGSFILDGTLLAGSWKVEGDKIVLKWSTNWIVDRLTFDAEKQLFHNPRGADYDIHNSEQTVSLALNTTAAN